jgi:hypothetical protein
MDSVNFDALFGSAMLLGLLAASWRQVRALLQRAVGLLVVRVKIDNPSAQALQMYVWKHFKRASWASDMHYGGCHTYVRPISRREYIAFEYAGSTAQLFWKGWRPLLLGGMVVNTQQPDSTQGGVVTYLRGTFNIDAMLVEAVGMFNAHRHGTARTSTRFSVIRCYGSGPVKYRKRGGESLEDTKTAPNNFGAEIMQHEYEHLRLLKWELGDLGARLPDASPWAALAVSPDAEAVAEECRRWYSSKDWYMGRGIPWRRGYGLTGLPGTGKSSFVRAVGVELDLPILVFDLATMSNADMVQSWSRALNSAPCIALFEDIDGVFDGRQNILGENGGGLSFDCLLNCLSGVDDSDGVLVFVTTNKPETLDEALGTPTDVNESSRPGRIDKTLEFGALSTHARQRIAERILSDCPALIAETVEAGDGDVGAQFQSRCINLAENQFWKGGHRNGARSSSLQPR